jgi:hypothetical protein
VLGRRLLALLLAVLCIVGWVGMEPSGSHANEVTALAGPRPVCGTKVGVGEQLEGPAAPDGLVDWIRALGPSARIGVQCPWNASEGAVPVHGRKGDPGAPRGPPSLVLS